MSDNLFILSTVTLDYFYHDIVCSSSQLVSEPFKEVFPTLDTTQIEWKVALYMLRSILAGFPSTFNNKPTYVLCICIYTCQD